MELLLCALYILCLVKIILNRRTYVLLHHYILLDREIKEYFFGHILLFDFIEFYALGLIICSMCMKLMQDEVVSKAKWFGQRLGVIDF